MLDESLPVSGTADAAPSNALEGYGIETAERTLMAAARAAVGALGLVEAQRAVRKAMLIDALERTSGNRHATARLLRVDRRYVTLMLKPSSSPRCSPRATDGEDGSGEEP